MIHRGNLPNTKSNSNLTKKAIIKEEEKTCVYDLQQTPDQLYSKK